MSTGASLNCLLSTVYRYWPTVRDLAKLVKLGLKTTCNANSRNFVLTKTKQQRDGRFMFECCSCSLSLPLSLSLSPLSFPSLSLSPSLPLSLSLSLFPSLFPLSSVSLSFSLCLSLFILEKIFRFQGTLCSMCAGLDFLQLTDFTTISLSSPAPARNPGYIYCTMCTSYTPPPLTPPPPPYRHLHFHLLTNLTVYLHSWAQLTSKVTSVKR